MADEEDDYLSDKFLQRLSANEKSSSSKTYAQRRKEAQRQAEIRNLAGRTKSRKELDEEAREHLKDGMNTSLFEKEKLAEAEGGSQSKAMKMMSKMGFKPGQSLGRMTEPNDKIDSTGTSESRQDRKRTAPIAIHFWEGKKGLGALKRPLSPDSVTKELERAAKVAKKDETLSHEDFRSRNRVEFEEKRDEGRLIATQKTCMDLDARHEILFNYRSINVNRPQLIPTELREALDVISREDIDDTYEGPRKRRRKDNLERLEDDEVGSQASLARRLREEMRRDALVSSNAFDGESDSQMSMKGALQKGGIGGAAIPDATAITSEIIEQSRDFLQMPVRERLQEVLDYMRKTYNFCFWCGTEYKDKEELDTSCPGETEEDHN